jgi:phosphate transport system substrate-binding protein
MGATNDTAAQGGGVRLLGLLTLTVLLSGFGGGGGGELGGSIHVDGSSTVYPITEAVVEQFLAEYEGIQVAVGVSGTGGGFKKFCAGEAEVADASRPLKESERQRCQANGVEPVEFPIALDGLSVMVNPANDFVSCLTVEELRRIWEPGSQIDSWSQIRPGWPDIRLSLYGPGVDSGSFDYFTEHIVGEEDASRADYAASEDDNVLVHGISGDRGALGYFGHAYYAESSHLLELVAIDAGSGCVLPNAQTINSGEYTPLTRPLYVYADQAALKRTDVTSFIRYYFENAERLAAEVGYVPLSAEHYEELVTRLEVE